MPSRSPGDGGTVSAELAVALPAVLLVLGLCLGGLRVGAEQVRLTDAAGLAARSLARHDAPAVTASLLRPLGGTVATVTRTGGVLCARLEARPALLGALAPVPLSAQGCALEEAPW